MKFNRFLVCLIALGLTTSCSNSIESGGSSGGDEILKSVECVTVLGLNEALEVHYQSGRIEIVTMGGSVDITSGVPVRWCSSERSGFKSDSSSIQAPSFRYEISDSTSNNDNPIDLNLIPPMPVQCVLWDGASLSGNIAETGCPKNSWTQ